MILGRSGRETSTGYKHCYPGQRLFAVLYVSEQNVQIKIKEETFCFLICAKWEHLTPRHIVVTPAHAHRGGGGRERCTHSTCNSS
jgi:hypothetical protein